MKERTRIRHSFDIYQDQLLSLKEIALSRQKAQGKRVLLGDLVQEALDMLIINEQKNKRTKKCLSEQMKERTRIRHSFDIYQDQPLSLKEIALSRQKVQGKRVLLGDLVQEALDMLIINEQKNE
jgi:hypothetical protein